MKISDLKGEIKIINAPQSAPISVQAQTEKTSIPEKITGFLGLEKTTDTLGSLLAKGMVSKEQQKYLPKPTGREAAGAGLTLASLLFPYGAVARGVGGALGSKLGGALIAGAAGGYALDVGQKLESGEEKPFVPGLGTAIGGAIPLAGAGISKAGQALKLGTAKLAEKEINSLIKPLGKDFSFGKNPGRTVSQRGITANTFEDLAKNISKERDIVGRELQETADMIPKNLKTNLSGVLSPFDEIIKKAVETNDQSLLTRVSGARDAITNVFSLQEGKIVPVGSRILENIGYKEGLQMKRIVGDLTRWTEKRTEDEMVNGALKRTYGLIKGRLDELASKSSIETAGKLRKLNAQYADLTSADIATRYRDILQKRQNLINLPGKIGIATSLIAAPFTGGVSTIILAIGSIGIDKALSSVAFKTRLAKWLARASSEEKRILFKTFPILETVKFPGDVLYQNIKSAIKERRNGSLL